MIQHTIDLRKYGFAPAKRIAKRLQDFIKSKNIKAILIFKFPLRGPIQGHKGLKVERHCPYCGSKLVKTLNGTICNGERLPEILKEIRDARLVYGDKAEVMISSRALRFYDLWLFDGHIYCDYVVGNSEKQFMRGRWGV